MHPSRSGPESYPHAFCCALTVQHTGTWFLGATLREMTGHGGTGWPPTAVCGRDQSVGYRIQHLYPHDFREGVFAHCPSFFDEWVHGTELPIVVTLRHPQKSVRSFMRRTGGENRGYTAVDHVRSFERLAGLLEGDEPGVPAGRVHAFRVDPETDAHVMVDAVPGADLGSIYAEAVACIRSVEMTQLLLHVAPTPAYAANWDQRVWSWAQRWPVYNSRPGRARAASVPEPRVPDELLARLGYEPLED